MDPKDLKPAIEFMKNLTPEDNVMLVMDTDPDGLTSGVLLSEYLEENNIPHTPLLPSIDFRNNVKGFLEENNIEKYTALITTDLSANAGAGNVKAFNNLVNKGKKVLIIDHHKWQEEPNEKVVYINPWNDKQDYPASAGMAQYIYDESGGKKDIKWLGYMGSTSDLLIFKSLNLIRLPKDKEKSLMPQNIPVGLTQIMKLIGTGYLEPTLCSLIFDLLKKSAKENNPIYIMMHQDDEARPLYQIQTLADKEIATALKELRDNAVIYEDIKWIYFKFKSTLNIKRVVVNLVGDAYPGYSRSVATTTNGRTSVSNRSTTPILHDLVPKSVEGFGFGGGHAYAAGCGFPAKYEKQWIENMKRLFKEYS